MGVILVQAARDDMEELVLAKIELFPYNLIDMTVCRSIISYKGEVGNERQ